MQTIKMTDQFGLDLDAQPDPNSALLKYFQQLPSLQINKLDLSKLGGLTLDQPALRSLTAGVSFGEPVSLGAGAPALFVATGAHATLAVITDTDDLPGQDESIKNPPDTCYVSFGLDASVSADVSVTSGELTFGAKPASKLELASYSRFPLKGGTTLAQAVQQTVAGFAIPATAADLADLPPGQIVRVALTGELTVSGTANLLAVTNPLASASLPAPLPVVSVSAGGSATVGVSCEIETEFEIVARKLDSGAVRLGWYRKDGSSVTVTAAVSEGISAGFGTTDLFSQVIGLISADPKADLKELANAGVPKEQAEAIQSAVKACACRKLEIAMSSAFTVSDSKAATFLYEIVPAALTAESRTAVDQALCGDLTGLHAAALPGVACVRSIWDTVSKAKVEWNVNLLGILNYRSVATLALEGKVLYEPATGSLVIADQATAQRIQSAQLNFGADTDRLRQVLAESFLITAAYHGTKQVAGAASLHCSHCFFELQQATSAEDMTSKLHTGVALGLLSLDEAAAPAGIADFGRTLFTASTEYDADLVTRMFLDAGGSPLAREWYESAGRAAIQFLVQDGDVDAVRRKPAIDDDLWAGMKAVGQPGFSSLFPGVAAPLVGAITADYSTIQWWAETMVGTAQKLAGFRLWMARNPSAGPDDPTFQKLRQDLASYLRKVAATTRNEFGQPWGLIAMSQLVARAPGATLLITGPCLVRSKSRALAAATGT
jgi:hypothetical protein